MIAERFCIDESSLSFSDETPPTVNKTLDGLLALLEHTRELDEDVSWWSDAWYIESPSGRTFIDVLTDGEIDRDIRTALMSRLGKLKAWDEKDASSKDAGALTSGVDATFAPSLARAGRAHLENIGLGLLATDQCGRSGWHAIELLPGNEPSKIASIVTTEDFAVFWREVIVIEGGDARSLQSLAPRMYPQLDFHPDVWSQLKSFEGNFRDVQHALMKNLQGLNDYAAAAFAQSNDPHIIAQYLSAAGHVTCSKESVKTRTSPALIKLRDVKYESQVVRCEWHAKLEPHRNRIHFAPRDGRILIGIFAAHLPI